MLHPGKTDPGCFQMTRFYPEMCLSGVNAQWVYSQGVIQKLVDLNSDWWAPPNRDDKNEHDKWFANQMLGGTRT